jgi:hypothetical protein
MMGGDLIGRAQDVERNHFGLETRAAFLSIAPIPGRSPHSRVQQTFDACYLCFCEVSVPRAVSLRDSVCPSVDTVETGLKTLAIADADAAVVHRLAVWTIDTAPLIPEVEVETGGLLATRILNKTLCWFVVSEHA